MNFDTKIEGAKTTAHLNIKYMYQYHQTKYTIFSIVVSRRQHGAPFRTTPTISLHEAQCGSLVTFLVPPMQLTTFLYEWSLPHRLRGLGQRSRVQLCKWHDRSLQLGVRHNNLQVKLWTFSRLKTNQCVLILQDSKLWVLGGNSSSIIYLNIVKV